ncbi:unnamed protein product [Ranitomeya imitator]|uniref:Tyr recombinase domain-containing protein n=1 Tax=Ranitomeya imitator TaxID=111125 RepID=A0ABN9L3A0_9NEOB|nr:unnamed protein product [Ranitomeya imitator]
MEDAQDRMFCPTDSYVTRGYTTQRSAHPDTARTISSLYGEKSTSRIERQSATTHGSQEQSRSEPSTQPGTHLDVSVKEQIWANEFIDIWSLVSTEQHSVDKERRVGERVLRQKAEGRSVNDGIPDDDTAVTYIPFDRAVEMVRKAGPGALMAKSDIESAFRLLPVHPDCYHLLGAMFEDKYYFDTCLPMGCSISCHYFEMFSTFLEWVARKLKTDKAIHALNFLSSSSLPVIKVIAFTVLKCLETNTWLKANAHNSINDCFTDVKLRSDSQASGVSGAAARNRISGVAIHFKLRGWPDSTKHFLIGQVLKGWRRASVRSDQRRPISFPLLSNLVRVSGTVCDSAYEATLISAAFSLAFFGAMRVSEILPLSRCRAGGLQLDDIVICDDGLRVRRSKTDQEGRGIWFPLFAIKGVICSLALIKSYMQVRGNGPQLFIHENGSPLFACQFLEVLRQALSFLGLPAADFGTHSFRIGAATEASRAGLFESDIQRMVCGPAYGWWAILTYIGQHSVRSYAQEVVRLVLQEWTSSGAEQGVLRGDKSFRKLVASSPTVVVIHAGGNDLASFPLAELLTLIRADLDKLPGFFPVMRLVWSELIPRLVWRGARELSAMERSRRSLNQRISRFIRFKNGVVVRHHRLEGDNSGFLLPDGVHLNDAGWTSSWMGFGRAWFRLHFLGGS